MCSELIEISSIFHTQKFNLRGGFDKLCKKRFKRIRKKRRIVKRVGGGGGGKEEKRTKVGRGCVARCPILKFHQV